jgi:PAS domain S-box-containing protein
MTDPHEYLPHPSVAHTQQGLNQQIARLFFVVGASISALAALAYGLLPLALSTGMRQMLVLSCLGLAVIFLLALSLQRRQPLQAVVTLVGCSAAAVILITAVGTGEGVHALTLGYLGLLVCLVTVLTSVRAGTWLAIAFALAIAAMAWGQTRGVLPPSPAGEGPPRLIDLVTHVLMLLAAVGAGAMMSRMLQRALGEAEEREQRFRGLLTLAADIYWETDVDLQHARLTEQLNPQSGGTALSLAEPQPWGQALGLSEADHAVLWSAMQGRRAFANLRAQRKNAQGQWRQFSLSGQPRFDAQGAFCGYWGVGKDITETLRAEQAVRASEGRYQELFARSPTPLMLQRAGRVMDANDAAARLFGFASAQQMAGFELAQLYQEGPSRSLHRQRMGELAGRPVGSAVAMADFQMRSLDERPITAQAAGVQVNEADGPATLLIYYDITERVSAENALRRSELMLKHVFATSPDFITLSELSTSRYLMVNESFSRIFGYRADEVVGRSALELGIWYRAEDRVPLVKALSEQGSVSDMPVTFVNKAGQPLLLQLSAARFELDGRGYMVVNGRDVTHTQRVQLEHEAMLQNALVGIALTREGRFVQVNERFERMFGWAASTLVGEQADAVWPQGIPLAEGASEIECELPRRDGSRFWCRLLSQPIASPHALLSGTIWIAEDVSERHQINQALASARDSAEAASRAKSAFLANTSHEIRTPLNGLLGLARLAMQSGLDEGLRQHYLAQLHESAQGLSGIISDILDLSKIEAGKFSVEQVAFDLRAVLVAVHHAYQPLAQAHLLSLHLHLAETLPHTVRGDPVRLRQILSNYITNAVKFTAHGEVRIEATPVGGEHIRFTVIDTGPGIDAATQARLFQPFTQADASTTRRYGGTGLGLSICKELAELMGGQVGVRSEPGLGSHFWVELPLPQAQAELAPAETQAHDMARLSGRRVLLVEDNPVNMMIGVAMLEQWGVEVVQASDGAEAVKAVAQAASQHRPFDAVLMDVHMPRLSGHEAARQIRQQHSAQALPIIALTAAALVSEREEALAAGMNDFLTKPIDASRLRQALARVVAELA